MQIADFALERYFARWEFAVKHVLCASDAEPVALAELLALADDDSLRRWDSLELGYTESLGPSGAARGDRAAVSRARAPTT